jgi:preprotein translocase subunit SecG
MQNVILVVHIIACIVMTVVIMLQKSEGGALGIGGGGGGLMTGRSAAGALVRVTMLFGGIFFITSLGLTTLANRSYDDTTIVERAANEDSLDAAPAGPIDLLDPTAPLLGTPTPTVTEPVLGETTEAPLTPEPSEETQEPVDNPQ